jgi:hypothetical protein
MAFTLTSSLTDSGPEGGVVLGSTTSATSADIGVAKEARALDVHRGCDLVLDAGPAASSMNASNDEVVMLPDACRGL